MRLAYADLAAGIAGEHLVCADLLLSGYSAFRTEQVCPYDIAAEIEGRLVRFQVKATRMARPFLQRGQEHIVGYSFNVRHGKGSNRGYATTAFDVLALVALDSRSIAYLPNTAVRQTMQFPTSGAKTSCKAFGEFSLTAAIAGSR